MEVSELVQLILLDVIFAKIQFHEFLVGTGEAEGLRGEQMIH